MIDPDDGQPSSPAFQLVCLLRPGRGRRWCLGPASTMLATLAFRVLPAVELLGPVRRPIRPTHSPSNRR
jgi:hypothetical protein